MNLGRLLRAVGNTNLVITPRLEIWLMQHGDDALEAAIAEVIRKQLVTVPRFRGASFSASSAGMCERRQVFQFLGVEQSGAIDPRLQNIFNDGKWRHLRWQAMLMQAGILTTIEEPLHWPNMRSRGTMDGMGVVPMKHPNPAWRGLEFGFELKGVSPFLFQQYKGNQAKEEHRGQVDRYFLSSGLGLFVIIYENKATQEWIEWVYEPEPARVSLSKDELVRLNRSVDSHKLPDKLPECVKRKGKVFQDCPYGGQSGCCAQSGTWLKRSQIHPSVLAGI